MSLGGATEAMHFRREVTRQLAHHPSIETIGESVESKPRRDGARQDETRIDRKKARRAVLPRKPVEDRGRQKIIRGDGGVAAGHGGEALIAIAAERAKLEAIVGEAEHLATGRGEEAAFGRRRAFVVLERLRQGLLFLLSPVEGLAQILAVQREAAGFGVAELHRHLDALRPRGTARRSKAAGRC